MLHYGFVALDINNAALLSVVVSAQCPDCGQWCYRQTSEEMQKSIGKWLTHWIGTNDKKWHRVLSDSEKASSQTYYHFEKMDIPSFLYLILSIQSIISLIAWYIGKYFSQ